MTNNTQADEKWEIWYSDTFDREAPPTVDVRGRGLIKGLAELWARHLFETVQFNGQHGFSSFHLAWRGGYITIDGDWQGAMRLRSWLFGQKDRTDRGYVQEADAYLLDRIAYAHTCLIDNKQITQQILALVNATSSAEDFIRHLDGLIKGQG